jgi:hypothetical protein
MLGSSGHRHHGNSMEDAGWTSSRSARGHGKPVKFHSSENNIAHLLDSHHPEEASSVPPRSGHRGSDLLTTASMLHRCSEPDEADESQHYADMYSYWLSRAPQAQNHHHRRASCPAHNHAALQRPASNERSQDLEICRIVSDPGFPTRSLCLRPCMAARTSYWIASWSALACQGESRHTRWRWWLWASGQLYQERCLLQIRMWWTGPRSW